MANGEILQVMTKEPSESGAIRQAIGLPGSVVAGGLYPLQALVLLSRTPKLWGCVLIPILLNGVIGAVLYLGLLFPAWRAIAQWTEGVPTGLAQGIARLPEWAARLLGWLPGVASVFDEVLGWLLAVSLLIITGLLLVQFGAILGAPWYGTLAEQIERLRVGQLPTTGTPSLQQGLRDMGRAIAFQLKKLVLAIGLGLPLFLCNFVPGLGNGVASIGGMALAAVLVGMDFLDAPLERRRLRFRTKLGLLGRTVPASATFSLVCLGLVSIPLLNLVMVPLCVAAGTLFCCDRVLPLLAQESKQG